MGNVNFVTVNINVDGKKETIKVEKGVIFQNIFVNGNKLEKQNETWFNIDEESPRKNWYGDNAGALFSKESVNEINMTKGEFALLKNIADNDKTVGFASAEGLSANPDNLHFSAKALREFGIRYYEEYKKIGYNYAETKANNDFVINTQNEIELL